MQREPRSHCLVFTITVMKYSSYAYMYTQLSRCTIVAQSWLTLISAFIANCLLSTV